MQLLRGDSVNEVMQALSESRVEYAGFSAGGLLAPLVFLVAVVFVLSQAWRIMHRMGFSTVRMILYVVLLSIPFVQIWVLWDVAHRPWPGQPEGARP
jgi:hypothetical protein